VCATGQNTPSSRLLKTRCYCSLSLTEQTTLSTVIKGQSRRLNCFRATHSKGPAKSTVKLHDIRHHV